MSKNQDRKSKDKKKPAKTMKEKKLAKKEKKSGNLFIFLDLKRKSSRI